MLSDSGLGLLKVGHIRQGEAGQRHRGVAEAMANPLQTLKPLFLRKYLIFGKEQKGFHVIIFSGDCFERDKVYRFL